MNKFHTTVSRRDFMKGLGLAGAGLGGAAALAPAFRDMDELTASSAQFKHPWYVKERDYDNPTVEIDWNVFQRWDRTTKVLGANLPLTATNSAHGALHPEIKQYIDLKANGRDIEYMKEKFSTYQGPSLRDYSVANASSASDKLPSPNFVGATTGVTIPTPESRGLAKWNGTPEENLQTITNAFKFFGATRVRVMEITDKSKKLFYKNSTSGMPYNFKDVEAPEEIAKTEYVIPNKAKYLILYSCLEATDYVRQAPAPTYSGYCHGHKVQANVHYFLGSMGFMHIEAGGFTPASGVGSFAGATEHSRSAMVGTSYSHGNLFRWMGRVVTDMPLAPTRPISAGIERFCVDCMTCAHGCPYESMPLGEKRWDHENPEEEKVKNYLPGYKGWRLYNFRCPRCKSCHGQCVFNGGDEALIHSIVRNTQAVTPLFNGFFANMHDVFGFGTRNPDEWWKHDVPTFQFDPTYLY
ncbi:reductive dehalogenase [Dehalogenimonas sp. 4OHTPN]|uniref:Reductive dehalogenase n=1 Tax=Dehalogenimonas sp. 4OHTPN TaxID=3166643 RepID=A0AAU8G8G2_9CHLR